MGFDSRNFVEFGLPASSLLARTPTQTCLPGRKARLLTLHGVPHAHLSVRLCRAIHSFSRATPAARLSRMADGDSSDGAGGAGSGSAPPPDAPSGPGTLRWGMSRRHQWTPRGSARKQSQRSAAGRLTDPTGGSTQEQSSHCAACGILWLRWRERTLTIKAWRRRRDTPLP
jgi:hypothetical protein